MTYNLGESDNDNEYEIDLFLTMIHDRFCGRPHVGECVITRTMDLLSTRMWANEFLETRENLACERCEAPVVK
jgi:hypothetical protein